MVSASTLQLIFIQPLFVGIWCRIEEKYPQLSKKLIQILPFLTMNLYEDEILHILQPKEHIRANWMQLSSIK